MKKSKMKWLAVPFALVFVLALSIAGFSALGSGDNPTVMLNGKTVEFEITNASVHEHSGGNFNLFTDMENLMPGDTVTETITVGVENFEDLKTKNVTIYLKAENPTGDYNLITEYADFKVTNEDGATIHESISVGESGIPLATYTADGSEELTVSLHIKPESGNELKSKLGTIDWVFSITSGPVLETVIHDAYIIGYPDGTVRPERQISRAEVATIYFRLLTEDSREAYKAKTNDFSDVNKGDWYNNAISTLNNAGIINGYPDGSFKPNEPITRAEMATIAAKFDIFTNEEVTVDKTFSDISGHWAETYILQAASRGWVNGYTDGTFRPDRYITRAEAMKLINYVLGRVVDEPGLAAAKGSPYYNEWSDNVLIDGADPAKALPWYYFHVQEATNSHDYYRSDKPVNDLPGYNYEEWSRAKEARDWALLELNW